MYIHVLTKMTHVITIQKNFISSCRGIYAGRMVSPGHGVDFEVTHGSHRDLWAEVPAPDAQIYLAS